VSGAPEGDGGTQHGPVNVGATGGSMDEFRSRNFVESFRHVEMAGRMSHYMGTNHDWKSFDFDGHLVSTGTPTADLYSVEAATWYVPLRMRRPCMPERLGVLIVDAFTNLVFGHDRFPAVRVHGDPDAERFCKRLSEAANLETVMWQARTLGGACGTVGLSWRYWQGLPRIRVHNGKNLFVHRWADREAAVPAHATEIYLFPRDEYDPMRKEWVTALWWHRRDWTEQADIVFQDVRYTNLEDPPWGRYIDYQATHVHNDGFCHLTWIKNHPGVDSGMVDGLPDYDKVYDRLDTIDIISSIISRGAVANLDPTLLLKMDEEKLNLMGGLKKGSDNAIPLGTDGEASYLEIAGTSFSTGNDLLDRAIVRTLRIVQCVLTDPDKVAAAGTSSVAMRAMFAPMLGKANIIRGQYGLGMARVFSQMLTVARKWRDIPEVVIDEESSQVVEQVERAIMLEERVELVDQLDVAGAPTGRKVPQVVWCKPGNGSRIVLAWGDYFPPSPTDKQAEVTTTSQAVLSDLMSQESGVAYVAHQYKLDPDEEMKRIASKANQSAMAEMSLGAGVGGQVPGPGRGQSPPKPKGTGAAPAIGRPPQPPKAPSSDSPKPPAPPGAPKPRVPPKPNDGFG
jgi:hypothetical protein